ncbi:MAG TPA: diacylglycerol kinase family protein [Polyangiaceae bacterium]|nr:diacylglycerol kinase family protein [Polyangiaceae bacterium]
MTEPDAPVSAGKSRLQGATGNGSPGHSPGGAAGVGSDPPQSSGPPSMMPPSMQRVAVVVNGRAKNVTQEVISTLDQILSGGDLFVSRSLEDAREIAKTLVVRGYDTVLTGGGDGTFTVMVTEIVREARRRNARVPRLGLLKLGTGNALAWVVGASDFKDGEAEADIRRLTTELGSRPVRFVEVEGYITPFCGLGADAEVLSDYVKVKTALGKTPLKRVASGPVSYAVAAVTRSLPGYVFRRMPHCRVINTGGDAYRVGPKGSLVGRPIAQGQVIYEGPMRLCALGTIPYFGYGFRVFPYADERPDRMHLRVATISPLEFVGHFKNIWKGDYENPESLFDFLVESVLVETDPAVAFQIGGDPYGTRSQLTAQLSPTTIQLVDFYAPPRADG